MKSIETKYNMNLHFVVFAVLALAFVLGVMKPVISAILFAILVVYVLIEHDDSKLVYLFVFLAPLSSIFKISATSTSLYTYLTFIFIIKMFFKNSISKKFLLVYLFLIAFCAFGIPNGYNIVIKQLSIPLLLYFFLNPKGDVNKDIVIKTFIFSLIIASFIGYFKDLLPNMSNYIADKSLRIDANVYTNRFSGLNGDPNYYSVNVLLGLVLMLYLIIKKKINIVVSIITLGLLVFFGAQTNSKSFILVLAGIIVLGIYTLLKNKRYFLTFALTLGTVIFIYLVFTSKITIFDTILARFTSDTNLSDLTTGRSDLFISYINYFNSKPLVYLIGNGFNCTPLNGFLPHNTYIDFIYNYGIVGTFIFLYLCAYCVRFYVKEKNIVCYLPLIIVLVSYFSLSELKYFDLPIHLFLVILLICGEKKECYNKTT